MYEGESMLYMFPVWARNLDRRHRMARLTVWERIQRLLHRDLCRRAALWTGAHPVWAKTLWAVWSNVMLTFPLPMHCKTGCCQWHDSHLKGVASDMTAIWMCNVTERNTQWVGANAIICIHWGVLAIRPCCRWCSVQVSNGATSDMCNVERGYVHTKTCLKACCDLCMYWYECKSMFDYLEMTRIELVGWAASLDASDSTPQVHLCITWLKFGAPITVNPSHPTIPQNGLRGSVAERKKNYPNARADSRPGACDGSKFLVKNKWCLMWGTQKPRSGMCTF